MSARVARCGQRLHLGDSKSHRLWIATVVGIISVVLDLFSSPAAAAAPDLVSVVIRGSTVYDAPALFGVYREQLGKPINQASARAIAAGLAAMYERDGYSRPQIKVDDALVAAGVLRFDVVEPRITDIRISGDPGPHRARLESLGSQLAEGPVRRDDVQATLRRMRDLPGLTLSATTQRDDSAPNAYRLDVDTEFEPIDGTIRLSNRGTDEAGPNFVLGEVVANGLLGGETSIGAMFSAATDYEEYHGLGVLASVRMPSGQMSFTGFTSRSEPHEPIVDRDDSYLRDRVTIGYLHPLAGVERATVSLSAGLDLDDLEILRAGDRLRDERLRMLKVGSSFGWRHGTLTQSASSVEIVKGLDAFGSGLAAFDLATDPRSADFALTRFSYTRLTRFNERWSVRLDALGQQSAYVLPYGERFKIGGDRLGRGFEVAEIAGDQGLGAKVELRRSLPQAPKALHRASLYGFYDIGAAWKQDAPGRESAATAGIGFGTQGKRVSATVELAQPLTHADVEGRRDLALFAELAVGL